MMLLPVLLLTANLAIGQIPDSSEFRRPLVQLFEAQWPKNRTVNIVCHGHSVPAGYFKTPVVQTFDAYPHLLHAAIKEAYPRAVVNVIVTAIGGENSEQGSARFQRDVLNLRPDVVTIDYSLNDRRIGLERAKIAWEAMIDSAKKAGVRVILLTPSWDLGVKITSSDDPLFLHADQVRGLARKHGVGLADSLDAFVKAGSPSSMESLMSQSNHPNRQGHELIVKELIPWFIAPKAIRETGS